MARVCQIGKIFRRCHNAEVGTCQYCGRGFCAVHQGVREDTDEVCCRELCLAKHDDLKQHLIYRVAAVERSNRGWCAAPDCENRRAGQCSKCLALYCDLHLRDREEVYREGMAILKRPVSVCDHCGARLKLWNKM
jgi:hypothetical protein